MFKIIIFLMTLFFGIYTASPTLFNLDSGKKINLGLDLKGGMYLTLEVNESIAVKRRINNLLISINNFVRTNNIILKDIRLNKNKKIIILSKNKNDLSKINNFLKELNFNENEIFINGDKLIISYSKKRIEKIKKETVNIVLKKIRDRLNIFGLSEPSVTKFGKNRIIVEIPGVDTIKKQKEIENFLLKKAKLDLMIVDDNKYTKLELDVFNKIVLKFKENNNYKLVLDKIPLISGDMIIDSSVGFNKSGKPTINFLLNNEGAQIFSNWTSKNIGKRIAIVLNNKIISAPIVQGRIGGGNVQITGNFDIKEAQKLSKILRSGAFPTEVKILEKRNVGASLGADSIKKSLITLIVSFVIILIFMTIYYKILGIVSNIALISNLIIIIGIMSLFQATLTLPGMAGIILKIGMSIDSNIIINERIKELKNIYKNQSELIKNAYNNALSSILDANITTLLVIIFLYFYGTGPVKGFAITMGIGILSSMVTSILGTQAINELLAKKKINLI